MNFYAHNQNNALFQILYKHTPTQEEINIKFLGVETDKHMNFIFVVPCIITLLIK
jgi:hypothetical protein